MDRQIYGRTMLRQTDKYLFAMISSSWASRVEVRIRASKPFKMDALESQSPHCFFVNFPHVLAIIQACSEWYHIINIECHSCCIPGSILVSCLSVRPPLVPNGNHGGLPGQPLDRYRPWYASLVAFYINMYNIFSCFKVKCEFNIEHIQIQDKISDALPLSPSGSWLVA